METFGVSAVPVWSLVCEHAEVGITDKIDHVIRCANVETVAEPVHCQVSRCHGIEQEVLQVLQGLGGGEKCFVCHVDIIGTGFGDLGSVVDSLPTGWAADQFFILTPKHVIE